MTPDAIHPSALPNLVQLAKGADMLVFNCAVLDPAQSPPQLGLMLSIRSC